jgi:Co/Zn/Cd efflux system component
MQANEESDKKEDLQYTYGYCRYNVLAAFSNMVYIQVTVLFKFLEMIHHMIEHKEIEFHLIPEGQEGPE